MKNNLFLVGTLFGQANSFFNNLIEYFVCKDIADVLGYESTNKAIRDHVDFDN
ncbi:Bro-N domain-containing protein [Pediococcus acidilactici]|uniref:BRO-N domain-containing protein n=1 Tax=Pediococcus acidilactici TaxID=1254 RepID=UPI00232BADB9|nr:Bro-N domain-containing protein [Pediococcus acidilactici]MDB8867650.1 Bro-N domain-containing protein [Pediococcus acidilactici]